jgi:DNA-binding CsgD family transcriptional regulator
MTWRDFILPVLAVLAGLPTLTLAHLLAVGRPTRIHKTFRIGIFFMTILAFLSALGIFSYASGLIISKFAIFVLWNLLFLLAAISIQIFRHFVDQVSNTQASRSKSNKTVWVGTILAYGATFTGAFFLKKDWPLWLSTGYYLAGLSRPSVRLIRHYATLPHWMKKMLKDFIVLLVPGAVVALGWELAIRLKLLPSYFPTLLPGLLILFFFIVSKALLQAIRLSEKPPESPGKEIEQRLEKICQLCYRTPLSRREKEVLGLILQQHRNRDIALILGIAENTVKNHIYNAFQKVGVGSREELQTLATSLDAGFPTAIPR